jgi:hypothetical protein
LETGCLLSVDKVQGSAVRATGTNNCRTTMAAWAGSIRHLHPAAWAMS